MLVHPREKRMEQSIRSVFTWKGLRKDVQDLCKHCHTCQMFQKSGQKKYGLLPEKAAEVSFLFPYKSSMNLHKLIAVASRGRIVASPRTGTPSTGTACPYIIVNRIIAIDALGAFSARTGYYSSSFPLFFSESGCDPSHAVQLFNLAPFEYSEIPSLVWAAA